MERGGRDVPTREQLLDLLQAGRSYEDIGRLNGITPGRAYMTYTAMDADASTALGQERCARSRGLSLAAPSTCPLHRRRHHKAMCFNMLRVFKVTSPMSAGSSLLDGFAPATAAPAFGEMTGKLRPVGALATTGGALMRASGVLLTGGAIITVTSRRSRLRRAAGALFILAGSALTRFGVFEAGVASAQQPSYTVMAQGVRLGKATQRREQRGPVPQAERPPSSEGARAG